MSKCKIIIPTCNIINVINIPDATYLCDTQLTYVNIRNMYVAKKYVDGRIKYDDTRDKCVDTQLIYVDIYIII